jgi:uncharacterized membrane protein YraQ (UPF0718 family)
MSESGHCQHHCHASDTGPVRPGRKLVVSVAALALAFLLSLAPPLAPFNEALASYFGMIWWAVLLGLLVGGMIDYFVPDTFIRSLLGGNSVGAVFRAVLAGFLMSACSHGILAISIQLYKKGAGVPSVIAFLLASPWANFPVTLLLFSFFGWHAALIVGAAILVALTTGFVFMALDRRGWIEPARASAEEEVVSWSRVTNFRWREAARGTWRGGLSLANMVLWWIIVGFLLAALIQAYVPSDLFTTYMGPTLVGLLVTLAVATVIEICSEGSAPLAFELYRQIGVLGNPFVFLMAGVVTDYTEIGLLWTNIGKRTALWLPVVAVPQVLLIAWVFNQLPIY